MPFLPKSKAQVEALLDATASDFTGGLNVVESDLHMDRKYATILSNTYRDQSGANAVRYGSRKFADLGPLGCNNIVGQKYFNNYIVSVDDLGQVFITAGTGASQLIFNNTMAQATPGSPAGWSNTTCVSFSETPGGLILNNGINKPLLVNFSMNCAYLVDPATGSNFFIPVTRNVSLSGRYVVMTGDYTAPSTIYIGNRDSYGVFAGSVPPNDGVNINLASRVPVGSAAIRGHCTFRDKLIVFFDKVVIVAQLGIYTASVHTPTFEDPIILYGSLNHNSIRVIGDNVVFPDAFGVQSVTRALFTGLVTPQRQSELIQPLLINAFAKLNTQAISDRVFSLYNQNESQYMLFVPTTNDVSRVTQTTCYAQTQIRGQREKTWAVFDDWPWRTGCESQLGRIFVATGAKIYVLGTVSDPITADYVNDEDTYSDGTVHTDGRGWSVPDDLAGLNAQSYPSTTTGIPIIFDWHFPWADFNRRLRNKFSKYISIDTQGTGRFTCDMFIDNFLLSDPDNGEFFTDNTNFSDNTGWFPYTDPPYVPALTSEFMGADFGGYGASPYGEYYGGGRATPSEDLYAWPAKFKLAKIRIHGETRDPLRFVTVSVMYGRGSIRR